MRPQGVALRRCVSKMCENENEEQNLKADEPTMRSVIIPVQMETRKHVYSVMSQRFIFSCNASGRVGVSTKSSIPACMN